MTEEATNRAMESIDTKLHPRSIALAAFVQEMLVKGADGRVLFVRTFQANDNWQEITFEHNSAPAPVMGNQ